MMEQLPEKNTDPVEAAASDDATRPSVGALLRAGRERLGLSIEDVVTKIKLAPRQIVALEADDFQALPETTFLRGFVRSYAKLLQLEVQPLLDALPGAKVTPLPAEQIHVDAPFPTEKTARRQNLNLLIAALVVALGIAGFAVWQSYAPHPVVQAMDAASDVAETSLLLPEQAEILDGSGVLEAGVPESAVPVVASAVPVVQAASMVTATASTLRLVFDKESWAEIKDQSGKTLTRQVNQAGSELRVEGVAPFTLVIGHAAAVHLYYREKPVDLTSYINAASDVARMTLE
ncbi:MAG: RodZ domain-containing protein [Gallionella sp.]|jgi:cytoskeleton protein RodZ